jgi:ABC-type bacteriocin/lantibiotic exporter with double-glycine peptidase domain
MQREVQVMIDYLFRFGTDALGQTILLGANWDLFWWCLAAGVAFVIVHAAAYPVLQRRKAQLARRIAQESTDAQS